MKNIVICIVVGLLGTAPFILGAASSSGGNYAILASPAFLLQHAVSNWGLPLADVQLNRWAVIAQFVGYFLITLLVLVIAKRLVKKHNKRLQIDAAKPCD